MHEIIALRLTQASERMAQLIDRIGIDPNGGNSEEDLIWYEELSRVQEDIDTANDLLGRLQKRKTE